MPKHEEEPFDWTATKEAVLIAVFEGDESFEAISEKFRITSRTLRSWRAHPIFKVRLEELRARFLDTLDEQGIPFVRPEQRIKALAMMALRAKQDFYERTKLLEVRPAGKGEPVTNEHFNDAAMREARAALADIAAELGQRKNITELTGKDGGPAIAIYLPEKRTLNLPQKQTLNEGENDGGSEP